MADFHDRFEEIQHRLLTKNLGLTKECFLLGFVSGLNDEVRHQVRMFKPIELKPAIQLNRLQEASLDSKRNRTWPEKPNYNTNQNTRQQATTHKWTQQIPQTNLPTVTYPN